MSSEAKLPQIRVVLALASILIVSLVGFALGFAYRVMHPESDWFKVDNVQFALAVGGTIFTLAAVLIVVACDLFKSRREQFDAFLADNESQLEQIKGSALTPLIVLSSALAIYAELMLIRAESGFIQIFSLFKSFTLVACLLGLGIGFTIARRWRLMVPAVMPMMAFLLMFFAALKACDMNWIMRMPLTDEAYWGLFSSSQSIDTISTYCMFIYSFVLTAVVMIPLGQLASFFLEKRNKLTSYNWNLVGGILGVAAFTVLSFFWTPPAIWAAVMFLSLLPFLRGQNIIAINAVAAVLLTAFVSTPTSPFKADIYSPIGSVTLNMNIDMPFIAQNNNETQKILDLSKAGIAYKPEHKDTWQVVYDLPYKFKEKPEHVLVLGAGAGNDVAAAVRNGAQRIDAVEIDPVVVDIGKHLHPEHPYQHAGVTVFAEDGRTYIRNSHKMYDLIVYGLLSSNSSLSGFAGGLRLDNFLYTTDAFSEAKRRLKPDGCLAVCARIYEPFDARIYSTIASAFGGRAPLVYHKKDSYDYLFVIGNGQEITAKELAGFQEISQDLAERKPEVAIATDDWPFMFMFQRQMPAALLTMIGCLLAVSLALGWLLVPEVTQGFSGSCFLIGAGFMLLETRAITQLAPRFGSTWGSTAVILLATFVLALFANGIVRRTRKANRWVVYLLTLAAIAVCSYLSGSYNFLNDAKGTTLAILTATVPLLFSGFAFSSELQSAKSISGALSANLAGCIVGAFLEYTAMYLGFGMLPVIAFQMYLLALILPIYLRYRWKITASGEPIVPKAKQAKPMPIKNSEKVEVEVAKSSGEPANG